MRTSFPMTIAALLMAGLLTGCADDEERSLPAGDSIPGAVDPGAVGPDTSAAAPGPAAPRAPGDATVRVWLARGEAPVAVERTVARAGPEAALAALVAGPTPEERARGLSSWFSDATVDVLGSVERRDGLLVVDFTGLDRLIPGAGSSAGSAQLLATLDSTVFQFPAIDSVEYRLDGSCEAFWEWLQRACQVSRRP